MKKVIFDCDNTMGIPERDVDDGLTLLYLLGDPKINLLAVTTTYGNSTLEAVHTNTLSMFEELKLDLPLYKGSPDNQERSSEAAYALVAYVNEQPGEITILATGSLTNLLGAYEIDNTFFDKVDSIVLMGGITEPLIINGKKMDELNFSCDAKAAYAVLSSNAKVNVLNAHICLQALFGESEYDRLMESPLPINRYIKDKTYAWFEFIMGQFGIKGFYNWDVVAAVYISHPELFRDAHYKFASTVENLETGLIITSNEMTNQRFNMPSEIVDVDQFNQTVFDAWSNVKI